MYRFHVKPQILEGLAPERLAHGGGDLGAEQLDRVHDLRVRHRADADLREQALVTEDLVLEEDLLDDLLRAADRERAARPPHLIELAPGQRSPATPAADPV